MFLISNILGATATILHSIIWIYTIIIIVSALLSWVNPDPYNPIIRTLRGLTEPVFRKIRRTFPFVYIGGIDLSPVVLLLALTFIDIAVVNSLADFAISMR